MQTLRTIGVTCLVLLLMSGRPAIAQQGSPQPSYLEGHQGAVRDVAITSDGRLVISAGVDGTLRLWDRATGQLLRTVAAHEKAILRLELSPDGASAALAGVDGRVRLLDLPRPYPLGELASLPIAAHTLATTADGQQVITADGSEVLRLFDVAKKQPVREFSGAGGGAIRLAILGPSKQLLATCGDGMLRSWNLENGQLGGVMPLPSSSPIAASAEGTSIAIGGQDGALRLAAWPPAAPVLLATHGDQATSIAMTPDGKSILSGGLDQQVLLHVEGMPAKALPNPGGRVTCVSIRQDASMAAAGLESGIVKFWRLDTGAELGMLAGHAGAVSSLAFHPQEPLVATAGADGTIRTWRQPQAPVPWKGHAQPATMLAASPDGKLALSAGADRSARIWNVADGKAIAVWENLPQPATAAIFQGDTSHVLLGDAAGNVSLRKVADGQVLWNVTAHGGPISDLALLADGRLVTAGADGIVKVWQTSAIGPPAKLAWGNSATAILSLADEAIVVVGTADGDVRFADWKSRKELENASALSRAVSALTANADRSLILAGSAGGEVAVISALKRSTQATLSAHASKVTAIAVHPKQPQFATAGEDGSIRLWNLPQPPLELAGHKSPVRVVVVSPDGKQATTGDASGVTRRWKLPDGTDAGPLASGKDAVLAAAYRRDGQGLATGDAAGVIRLFQTSDGAEQGTIGAHDGGVTGLSFHPNHSQLLSSGADGVLRLWQLPLIAPKEVSKSASPVRGLAATSDGNTAIIGDDKGLRIVDLATAQERAAIDVAAGNLAALAVSPDNAQLAVVTQAGTMHVAALADGKVIAEIGAHAGSASAVAYRPQGGQLATAGSDGQLRIWELPAAPRTFSDHTERVIAAAVSPSGQWLATASADKTVRLWNLADGSASWTLGHDMSVSAIAWKPDSTQIAAAAGKLVQVWNTSDGQQAAALDKHAESVAALAFAPDGASLYTAGGSQTIQQWKLADGSLMRSFGDHDKPIKSLTLVAGGAIMISASEDGAIHVWNTAAGTRTGSIVHGGVPTAIAASGDGKWLAIAGPDKAIKLYDLADGVLAQSIGGLASAPKCLVFSGDHLSLAGGSADGAVRIWNLQGQLQEFVPSADNPPTALAFLPDHRQLAIGGQKGLVRIHRRALVKALPVAETPLTALAWSADGQFILTGSKDKTLKLWNVADGNLARQFSGQADAPRCLAITKDGTKVIAGCEDKSLRVWNYSDGGLIATLLLASPPRAIAASPDGSRIAAAEEQRLRVWDLATQRMSEQFDIAATALAMPADGKQLVVGDAAGVARRVMLANAAVVAAHVGEAAGAVIDNAGQRWLSAGRDKSVKAWDAAGNPVASLGVCDGLPAALALRADGQQVAVAGQDRQIYLWRLDNNQLERKIPAGAAVVSLAYHPSQPKLAAACADGRLRIFNPADGSLLETVHTPSPAASMAFAGDRLLAGHADHAVRLHAPALQRIVTGHQGAVTTLAYSADGGSLFSGGIDKTVRQWNSTDGAAVRTVVTAADAITGLILSADGTRLMAASADKTIRVHNVADGAAVATYNSPAPIRSLAASKTGSLLATGGDDGMIRVWDAKTAAVQETLSGVASLATALTFSPDGADVIAATSDAALQVWPLACTNQIAADATKVHDLIMTPDGQNLVTSGEDKTVKLWDSAGTLVRTFAGSAIVLRSVAVSPDGTQIVAGGDPAQAQPQLLAWKLADGQLQFNLNLPAAISRVMFLDSQRIAVACVDQKVRVLSATDGKLLEEVPLPAAATAIAVAADRQLVTAAADNMVYRVQSSLLWTLPAHEGGATAVAWTANGREIFSAGADKLVRQWDAVTGKPMRTLVGSEGAVTGLALSADGQYVAASCADQKVRIWDLKVENNANAAEVVPASTIPQPTVVRSVAYSGNGTRIIMGGDDGLVRCWHVPSGKELERFAGHTGAVLSVAANADGTVVASSGADRTVRRHGTSVAQFAVMPGGEATALALSPDGRQLFTAGRDGKISSWSAVDLAHLREYTGAAGPIRSLATTPRGDWLAAGGDDAHFRIWSTETGSLLADVTTHTPITAVKFVRAGRLAIVAGSDGILRHYELAAADGKVVATPILLARGHTGAIRDLVMSADERLAFTVGSDAKVYSWLIADSQPRWTSQPLNPPILALAFRPDGQEIAVADADGSAHVLSPVNGKTLRQWKAQDGPVLGLSWRNDGQELASVGGENSIQIWNLEGKEAGKIAAGVAGPLHVITWSPEGSLLQAAGRGRLWQTFQRANQQQVRQAEGHNHTIVALRYSASGQRVATLDDSGKFFVWDAANGSPLFHQQLSVAAAFRLAWSPDATEIVVATSDPRVIRVPIPAHAR